MSFLRFGYVSGPIIGALWLFILSTTVAITMSFATGDAFRPAGLIALIQGAVLGYAACLAAGNRIKMGVIALLVFALNDVSIVLKLLILNDVSIDSCFGRQIPNTLLVLVNVVIGRRNTLLVLNDVSIGLQCCCCRRLGPSKRRYHLSVESFIHIFIDVCQRTDLSVANVVT